MIWETPLAEQSSNPPSLPSGDEPTRHDQLLKTVLWNFFPELIELVEPELARRLDTSRMESLDKELFTDLPQGRRREVDLLVRAPLVDGTPRLVLVHVEIEAEFRKQHIDRMLRYYLQIRGRFPDEPVLPIAVYLKGGPIGQEVLDSVESIVGFEVLHFRYHAMGLSQDLAETYLDRPNVLGWALAALMRSERFRPEEQKLECLRRIATSDLDEARTYLLANIVETYLELTEPEEERYNKELATGSYEEVKTMQLTWEEKHYYRGLREGEVKGHAEGIAEGRQAGLLEGSRRTLTHLIESRLGKLPASGRRRLKAIDDPRELDRLGARLLEAKTLGDLGLDE